MHNFNNLKSTHPNLFFAVIVFGLWGIFTGLNFLLTPSQLPMGNLQYVIGTAYIFFGTSKLAGLLRQSYISISRYGMIGCMVLSGLLATTFLAWGLMDGSQELYNSLTFLIVQSILNFLALGVVQMAAISEPAANPLTMKRESDE